MVNVSLQIEGKDLNLSPADLKDLGSASTDLKLICQGLVDLGRPLSDVPDGALGNLTLDAGNPSWKKIFGSPATFSLKAKATATISLQSKGSLFSYYSDLDNTQKVDVPVKSGLTYVVTEFHFQMSGDLSASATLGAIGVTTDDSGSTTYTVRNYKAFAPNTVCRDALAQAVTAFALPLHSKTVPNLSDGDCIYYEFDGALNVGFGVTYGVSSSVGGYSLSEIGSIFRKVGNVANISASKAFTAGANAGVSLKFNWSRSFQCFLERSKPDAGQGSARLHLLTGKSSQRSLELSVNGGITNISAPQLSVDTQTLTQKVLQAVTGQPNPPATSPFQTPINQVQQEIQKYVDDANQWLSSLTQKVKADGGVSISLLFQDSKQLTNAFTWDFNVGHASFIVAWNNAVSGDFVAAMATAAATLEAGSGFELVHTKNTTLTFTFFGLGLFSTVDSYFAKSAVRYGGNGVFYLETNTGKLASSKSKSRSTSTSVYLDGTAQSPTGGSNVTDVQIELHGVLTTNGNQEQVSRLGLLLQSIGTNLLTDGGQQALVLGNTFKAYARQSSSPGAALVHIIYKMSALNRLQSDEYVSGNQGLPPHLLDAANWNAYAWASGLLPSDPAVYLATFHSSSNFYKTYDSWAAFNCLVIGSTDPEGNPTPQRKTDRHGFGDYQPAVLRDYFNKELSDTDCNELRYYFSAGQQYMNLCDDLHSVASQASASVPIDWTRLTTKLEQIAGDDIDAWFGPAVLLALAQSTQASTATVQQGKLDPSAASGTVVISIS